MFGRERKRRRQLEADFGKKPQVYYASGDMEKIRAYFEYRQEQEPDAYCVDDVTWHDLDMARVFVRINPGLSTPGEQYLYDTLRHPALEQKDFEARKRLIEVMEGNLKLRLDVQVILSKLGRTRRADLCTSFQPERRGIGNLLAYIGLAAALVVLVILAAITRDAGIAMTAIILFSFNITSHSFLVRRIQRKFDTVNYSVAEVFAMRRIQRLHNPAIDREMECAYKAMDGLQFVLRTGGVSSMGAGEVGDMFSSILFLDLITYEFLKNRLWIHQKELLTVFQALGQLDVAIAVASWRKSVDFYTVPKLSFDGEAVLDMREMTHPLLEGAVPNDLEMGSSILLTGSNASGKSTYLRTALINVLLAQSLCTALADQYRGSAFYLYSSMALEDDLLAGESYYVTEIKSIRRILEAAKEKRPILCAVDEVLRGTNTVERIAASSTILEMLFESGVLCLAATHDGELCSILNGKCRLFHFQEEVEDGQMVFDYRIYPGPAHSRNAIKLLELMGFDQELVLKSEHRAQGYMDTGNWQHSNA